MSRSSSSRCTSFAGRRVRSPPAGRRPAPTRRADDAGLAQLLRALPHVGEQALGLDDVDDSLDQRAGQRAAAERRAEVVVFRWAAT